MFSFGKKRARTFDALVRPHMDSLFKLAWHLCGDRNDAEDLLQDVLVKLMPKTDELASIERPRPWLKRVLYRQFIDNHRRHARRPEVNIGLVSSDDDEGDSFMDRVAADTEGPVEALDTAQLQETMQSVLQELKPEQRALVIMHDMEGRSQEEISGILDIPVGTIKSRLHRTRAQLKRKVALKLEPGAGVTRVRQER